MENRFLMIFAFLKYCLGNKVDMNNIVVDINWRRLYTFASKQSLLGFCFDGIKRLGNEYSEELKKNPIERDLLITSITLRLMGVSLSWMNLLGLIGAFLRNMLIFRKRIQSMRY